jgi:hypothetical protein
MCQYLCRLVLPEEEAVANPTTPVFRAWRALLMAI